MSIKYLLLQALIFYKTIQNGGNAAQTTVKAPTRPVYDFYNSPQPNQSLQLQLKNPQNQPLLQLCITIKKIEYQCLIEN